MINSLYALVCSSMMVGSVETDRACSRALEAYFFEYKLDEKAKLLQRRVQRRLEDVASREVLYAVGTAYVFVSDKSIQFHTSNIPYVQRTTLRIGSEEMLVNFGWRF